MRRVSAFFLVFMLFLAGCQTDGSTRFNTAYNIAKSGNLSERRITTTAFVITAFERVTEKNTPINIYIEGDGLAWLGKRTPSLDPTPANPLALRLAVVDPAKNIIYMARPCQYTKTAQNVPCDQIHWTSGRFSPEIISALDMALDDIKTRYHAKGFHLIGYSGGAAIGALLAEHRKDVLSLRTVAGNLDIDAFSRIHSISPLSKSMNPLKAAPHIAHIPQRHFSGSKDAVVTREIAASFMDASGDTRCAHVSIVPDTTHEAGWAEKWPGLLSYPVTCGD